jgi:uncharacterized protein (DUF305 family)
MKNGYASLTVQTVISGVIMYLVMFVMINRSADFFNNLNMFYMTLMMIAPMVVVMMLAMNHMFPSRIANMVTISAFAFIFLGSYALIRTQTTIDDKAFLRSMIPHHSGAILMCREAQLSNPEIIKLCQEEIIPSQQKEISQMKRILDQNGGS